MYYLLKLIRNGIKNIYYIFNFSNRDQLFISTGFYSTLMASAIASKGSYNSYLLITLDRQSADSNIEWAKLVYPEWKGIEIIAHADYYDLRPKYIKHKWKNRYFLRIFSNHPNLINHIDNIFYTLQNKIYDEGLTTLNEFLENPIYIDLDLYTVNTFFQKWELKNIYLIGKVDFLSILRRSCMYYDIREISPSEKNIVYV